MAETGERLQFVPPRTQGEELTVCQDSASLSVSCGLPQ